MYCCIERLSYLKLTIFIFSCFQQYKGTPVTLQNFLEWKAKFDAEMIACGKRKVVEVSQSKRLTGKQLFEQDSTLNESDIKFLTSDPGVKVDESLFQDFEDLDLDEEFLDEME